MPDDEDVPDDQGSAISFTQLRSHFVDEDEEEGSDYGDAQEIEEEFVRIPIDFLPSLVRLKIRPGNR